MGLFSLYSIGSFFICLSIPLIGSRNDTAHRAESPQPFLMVTGAAQLHLCGFASRVPLSSARPITWQLAPGAGSQLGSIIYIYISCRMTSAVITSNGRPITSGCPSLNLLEAIEDILSQSDLFFFLF